MNIYSDNGISEFIILVGYKGHLIKEYFINYMAHVQDVRIDVGTGKVTFVDGHRRRPAWTISVIDTGESTMTGGRLKRVENLLKNDECFALTYGDGVADINIREQVDFHRAVGTIGTVTAVSPPGRFGALDIDGSTVRQFVEKPVGDGAFINGGFFILTPAVFPYLSGDECVFEQEPLKNLARDGQLSAYQHRGFWQCMDTLRDKQYLEALIESRSAPWMSSDKSNG